MRRNTCCNSSMVTSLFIILLICSTLIIAGYNRELLPEENPLKAKHHWPVGSSHRIELHQRKVRHYTT